MRRHGQGRRVGEREVWVDEWSRPVFLTTRTNPTPPPIRARHPPAAAWLTPASGPRSPVSPPSTGQSRTTLRPQSLMVPNQPSYPTS